MYISDGATGAARFFDLATEFTCYMGTTNNDVFAAELLGGPVWLPF